MFFSIKIFPLSRFSSSKIIIFPNDHQLMTPSIFLHDFPPWISIQTVHPTSPNHSTLCYHYILQWHYFLSILSDVDNTVMRLIPPNTSAFLLSIFFLSFLLQFFDIAFAPRFSVNWKKMWKLIKKNCPKLKIFVQGWWIFFPKHFLQNMAIFFWEKKKLQQKICFKIKILPKKFQKITLIM